MALEDLAMFRAVESSTVFYPSDPVSLERSVELCANTKGICYMRGARTATPVVYTADTKFEIGVAQVLFVLNVLHYCVMHCPVISGN